MMQHFSLLCCAHANMGLQTQEASKMKRPVHAPGISKIDLSKCLSDARRALADAPFVVTDDGALIPARYVCTDLFTDLGFDDPAHADVVFVFAAQPPDFVFDRDQLDVVFVQALQLKLLTENEIAKLRAGITDGSECEASVLDEWRTRVQAVGSDVGICDTHNCESSEMLQPMPSEIHAHKLVLSLSSPTFAAMFSSQMAEGSHTCLTRVPMDSKMFNVSSFRAALRYIYTGLLPDSLVPTPTGVTMLLELLRVADYLTLAHLKQVCERLFIDWEVLQVENVVNIFDHSCQANCSQLRAACVQFIRAMFDLVKETEAFLQLPEALKREVQNLR